MLPVSLIAIIHYHTNYHYRCASLGSKYRIEKTEKKQILLYQLFPIVIMSLALQLRTTNATMRVYLLVIQSLIIWSAFSSDPNQNNRVTRKRIDDENGIGRRYLESLWESVERKSEKDLEPGRFRYLESMMSIAMSFPTDAPTQRTPTSKPKPISPTKAPTPETIVPTKKPAPVPSAQTMTPLPTLTQPSLPPTPILLTRDPTPSVPSRGPTLPTREPVPAIAPAIIPSTSTPVEVPTVPLPIVSSPPTPLCLEDEKEDFLLEVLSRITDKSNFLDLDTPQGLSFSFLLKEEPSFVCTPTIIQRYGLSTFYFATGGAKWTNNDSWLGPTQECEWFGVKCNDSLFSTGLNLGKRRTSRE